MTQKHSPRPWTAGTKTDNWWKVYAENNRQVAEIKTISPNGQREKEDFSIEKANARLIAAAPELLEACNKTILHLRGLPNYDRLIETSTDLRMAFDVMRAAIAKTEGEQT